MSWVARAWVDLFRDRNAVMSHSEGLARRRRDYPGHVRSAARRTPHGVAPRLGQACGGTPLGYAGVVNTADPGFARLRRANPSLCGAAASRQGLGWPSRF